VATAVEVWWRRQWRCGGDGGGGGVATAVEVGWRRRRRCGGDGSGGGVATAVEVWRRRQWRCGGDGSGGETAVVEKAVEVTATSFYGSRSPYTLFHSLAELPAVPFSYRRAHNFNYAFI
jgi:hypothetical protein